MLFIGRLKDTVGPQPVETSVIQSVRGFLGAK
jgi:hypothetical protein